mgnify:CR=1 FL=1
MDLKKLAKSSLAGTFTFNLLHPETGEELGVKMSVVSAKSDKAFAFMRKTMKKEQLREIENAKSRKPKLKDLADFRADTLELAVNRLEGWEGLEWEGKPLEFSEDNARMVLSECDWIVEQVLDNSNDLGKFLKA